MRRFLPLARPLLPVLLLFSTQAGHAITLSLRLLNYLPRPLPFEVHAATGTLSGTCAGANSAQGELSANAGKSCVLEIETKGLALKGAGLILLGGKSGCQLSYTYEFWNDRGENDYYSLRFSDPVCGADLEPSQIGHNSPRWQASQRPLASSLVNFVNKNAQYAPRSIARADCNDGAQDGMRADNCVAVMPLFDTAAPEESSLQNALNLQDDIALYEPLSEAQFFGTHNSAISPVYTTSEEIGNTSHADPDNVRSLTDQLQLGARQLELDIIWDENEVRICHNHVKAFLDPLLCAGNPALREVVPEIATWVQQNPGKVLLLYLDINQPLTGHIADLDAALSLLAAYILNTQEVAQAFALPASTLPVTRLSKAEILTRFKRQVVIVADADRADLALSKFVFAHAEGTDERLPHEKGLDDLVKSGLSCSGSEKYDVVHSFYDHEALPLRSLRRLNTDRTTLNYMGCSNGELDYSDYLTPSQLRNFLRCPLNIFSMNMLGAVAKTAEGSEDARPAAFLWSWASGFPHTHAEKLAVLDTVSGNYRNDRPVVNGMPVLCFKEGPHASGPQTWLLASLDNAQGGEPHAAAHAACTRIGARFAVPPNSYRLDDALYQLHSAKTAPPPAVLINYAEDGKGGWTANDAQPLRPF